MTRRGRRSARPRCGVGGSGGGAGGGIEGEVGVEVEGGVDIGRAESGAVGKKCSGHSVRWTEGYGLLMTKGEPWDWGRGGCLGLGWACYCH